MLYVIWHVKEVMVEIQVFTLTFHPVTLAFASYEHKAFHVSGPTIPSTVRDLSD